MRIAAFGDSFVEGLIKDPNENRVAERQEINFVTQIVKRHGLFSDVQNFGKRGASNHAICFRALQYIERKPCNDTFILVVLTSPYRYQTYNPDKDEFIVSNDRITTQDHFAYQRLMIKGLEAKLSERNIPYMILNGFFVDTDNVLGTTELNGFLNSDKPNNTLFDILLGSYCDSNSPNRSSGGHAVADVSGNHLISGCMHPSVSGHQVIADVIAKEIKKII